MFTDFSNYNSRLGDAARHPVAQKKHQMFGRRVLQDQSTVPALPHQAAAAGPGLIQSQSTNELPVKYEYEPYSMHHPAIANNLEGAPAGVPILNKHQMNQQQTGPEMKYSCSLDFARQNVGRGMHDIVGHNHTYTLPHGATGATPRPQQRDKKSQKKAEEEHLSRDEKRARTLNVSVVRFFFISSVR